VKLRNYASANLVTIGQAVAEIWGFSDSLKRRSPRSWICKNSEILTVGKVKGFQQCQRTKLPGDRSKRCWHVAIFRFFRTVAAAVLDVLKFETFKGRNAQSSRQIWWRSVSVLLGYSEFSTFRFFKNCCSHHLAFLKFRNFEGNKGQKGQTASPCQISWRLVKPFPTYGNFWIFQNDGRRHVGFLKFRNLNRRKCEGFQTVSRNEISWH